MPSSVTRRFLGMPDERMLRPVGPDFLHLLRRLPEKKIGADRSSQNRDECSEIRFIPMEDGQERSSRHLPDGNPNEKYHADIREEHEGKPFQNIGIAVIGNKNLKHDRDERK